MSKIAVIGVSAYRIGMNARPKPGFACAADGLTVSPGGSGLLISEALARLGCETQFLSAVGEDEYATRCLDSLEKAGVDHRLAVRPDAKTSFVCAFSDGTSVVYKGAELRPLELTLFEEQIRGSSLLVICTDIPQGVADAALRTAKQYGVQVAAVICGADKPDISLLSAASYVIAAERDKAYTTLQFCERAIVLRGGLGTSWRSKKDAFYAPSAPELIKNTDGCFESFCAGAAYKLSSGAAIAEAALYARACAGFSAGKEGIVFPGSAAADKLFREMKK